MYHLILKFMSIFVNKLPSSARFVAQAGKVQLYKGIRFNYKVYLDRRIVRNSCYGQPVTAFVPGTIERFRRDEDCSLD